MPTHPPAPPVTALPRLCIDVSNTIEAASLSGVQRVTLGLGRALADQVPVELLDGRTGKLHRATRRSRRQLHRLSRGGTNRSILTRFERRALRSGFDPLPAFSFGADTILLDIEASWHAPQPRAQLLPLIASSPTVALLHDILPITNPEWFPTASVERFEAWFHAHIAAGSTLLAVSTTTAQAVDDATSRNPAVIRMGSDDVDLPISTGEGILMVGTIEPRKGHTLLLDALDLLGDDAPIVDVVGRPGWENSALFDRLDGHPSVRWHRSASDADLDTLWNLSGLLVQPSLGEGFGLPVTEALQRRVAVAASDIDVMREVSRGQATLLPAKPETWADMIRSFADAPESWPRPERLDWPTWREGASDVLGALVSSGLWPDPSAASR